MKSVMNTNTNIMDHVMMSIKADGACRGNKTIVQQSDGQSSMKVCPGRFTMEKINGGKTH